MSVDSIQALPELALKLSLVRLVITSLTVLNLVEDSEFTKMMTFCPPELRIQTRTSSNLDEFQKALTLRPRQAKCDRFGEPGNSY